MSFTSLGLEETIIQAVYACGHCTPTHIQTQAIPPVLQGRDIIGCAPTGTGKTAAFVLPVLSRMVKDPGSNFSRSPKVLVLTPTRELALQVEEAFRSYCMYTELRVLSVYGGVSINNQLRELKRGVDIIVATPGRLLDHLQRRTIDLSKIATLVLDEADRMYDMGFVNDVKKIVAMVQKRRQTLLFSATMSDEIRSLVVKFMNSPKFIGMEEKSAPAKTITQQFFEIPRDQKFNLLKHILQQENAETVLVFSRTKHGADRIKKRLDRNGIASAAIHSNRSQGQRQRALEGFKKRQFRVLVATDIAARGIDIAGVSHVVNFDTPAFVEDYIHRIGRTGRAELKGKAMTLVSEEEIKSFRKIEKHTGCRFKLTQYPGFKSSEVPPKSEKFSSHKHMAKRAGKKYRKPAGTSSVKVKV
ncbi:ATP-dependent RNA helicase RhlE [Chitinispirillum alkaliphilum]|nr:ATP-dependent RNA helicase RhlE [Chitinispirillum alkaliphilum]